MMKKSGKPPHKNPCRNGQSGYRAAKRCAGFSLLELAIAMAVLVLMTAIAIPTYNGYIKEGELQSIIREMQGIELLVKNFYLDNDRYPETLAEVDGNINDPWGNPYQYLAIEGGGKEAENDARKDHNLHPINSDFDLYSSGADGKSVKPLTGGPSKDDIIRANNGNFYGYGKDY